MVHIGIIEARLSQLGVRVTRWFRAELHELQHVLLDHEKIMFVVSGRYFGGFALLVATDQRMLIIDRKVLFLSMEDIRYDMISEINFNTRLIDASMLVFTVNKQHRFVTIKNKQHLRNLARYVQQRVMEFRQYQSVPTFSTVDAARPIQVEAMATVGSHLSSNTHRVLGGAAIQSMGSTGQVWANPNPYTKTPLAVKQMSRLY